MFHVKPFSPTPAHSERAMFHVKHFCVSAALRLSAGDSQDDLLEVAPESRFRLRHLDMAPQVAASAG